MACKKEGVPFSGTPEQEAALKKVITELKDTKGALMPIMQQAQDIYGYLPIEVQTMISDETGIPEATEDTAIVNDGSYQGRLDAAEQKQQKICQQEQTKVIKARLIARKAHDQKQCSLYDRFSKICGTNHTLCRQNGKQK